MKFLLKSDSRFRLPAAFVLASLVLLAGLLVDRPAQALDLASLSRADATAGVKAALEKGSEAAVASLGVQDGFLGNPKVRIPLPDGLKQAERVMKLMGRQNDFDELVVNINRAAEAAIPDRLQDVGVLRCLVGVADRVVRVVLARVEALEPGTAARAAASCASARA